MKRHQSGNTIKYTNTLLILGIFNLITLDIWWIMTHIPHDTNVLGTSTKPCPSACISYINQATGNESSTKEYYVPLGSGSNQSRDWVDVEGAQATVDTAQYGRLKKVTFDATIEVPVGAQISYVRLYNATGKHPVWFSEVNTDTSQTQLLVSSPIKLDSGENLYKVQMKSQLGARTNLIQSRIHILTY